MMEICKRQNGETDFEWKLRLCKYKVNDRIDLDWQEISNILALGVSGDHLRKTAYGIIEYDNYLHNKSDVATIILAISDLHIPFQLPITTFFDYKDNVDILQINGDIVDNQSISKFPKQYRIPQMEEIISARAYLINLIRYINPKKVFMNWGNHDIRFSRYLSNNLDTDVLELMPNTSAELIFNDGFTHYDKKNGTKSHYSPIKDVFVDSGIEINFVDDYKCKIGKTWFIHPTTSKSGILATCDKAKSYLDDVDKEGYDCVVCGHTHQIADSKKGFKRLIEQGASCYTEKMLYTEGRLTKPQQKGFAVVYQNKDGSLLEDKTKVIML
ncbi:MAG: metallophosphoesterase [Bacteroidaceae bacterium]